MKTLDEIIDYFGGDINLAEMYIRCNSLVSDDNEYFTLVSRDNGITWSVSSSFEQNWYICRYCQATTSTNPCEYCRRPN